MKLALLVIALLSSAGCAAPGGGPGADARWGPDDVEYQLAAIDAGGQEVDDRDVEPYATALDDAEPLCEEDRGAIADLSVRAAELVEEQGGSATVIEIVRGIGRIVPEDAAPMTCSEVLEALVALMVSAG